MVEIREAIDIDAPRDTVWKQLADLDGIQDWAAPIAEAECDGEPGPKAVRRCRFADGGQIEETITEWAEGEGLAYRISSDNPVFDGAESVWRIEDGETGTRVTYEMDVNPPEGAEEEASQELTGTAQFLLQALKTNVETGEVLEPPQE